MKFLQIITFAIIGIGLIGGHFLLAHTGMRGAVFVLSPYLIMLGLAAYINFKKATAASHIALFIAALAVCIITVSESYNAIFHPGSSTAGLTFLVMPAMATVLFLGIYSIANAVIGIGMKKQEESIVSRNTLKSALIILVVSGCYLLYHSFRFISFNNHQASYKGRGFTDGDTIKARKFGVFVKSLHYKVDSFDGVINFYPYIEKGFQYRDNSAEIEPLADTAYPYTVSFQRKAVKDAAVVIKKEQQSKLQYYNRYLLEKPRLEDTIFLEIKRSGVVLGTIKIWD